MTLSQQEITQFYRIWCALVWGVNEKHGIVPKFEKPVYGNQMKPEPFIAIRAVLWDNPEWIDDFIRNNECRELTETDLEILADWRINFVKDRFILMRHLKKYSVFMTFEEDAKLYGVCGITDSFSEMVPSSALPLMLDTTLLPFNGKIIYDSFVGYHNFSFGGGYKESLKQSYNEAKTKTGILENMSQPPKARKPALLPAETNEISVPKAMSAKYMEISKILEAFCNEKLNAEYKELCLKALVKLCRKRPSPLVSGKARTWACGIAYAIGQNNFIFDKSQPISMTAGDIADWFGIAKSTAGSKANEISSLLKLSYSDFEFVLSDIIMDSPMIWMLSVNGYLTDIRKMPREVQEQAYIKGLIPYIPADRTE